MPKRIFIYGRDISSNEYVTSTLEAKYNVWRAENQTTLVNFATGHHADLILFEMSKSRKKELNTLKTLKSLLPEVIILVIADKQPTKEVANILKHGATDIFPKPYDPHLLMDRVEALLKKS